MAEFEPRAQSRDVPAMTVLAQGGTEGAGCFSVSLKSAPDCARALTRSRGPHASSFTARPFLDLLYETGLVVPRPALISRLRRRGV